MAPLRSTPAAAHAATMMVRGQAAPSSQTAASRFKVYANPQERVRLPSLARGRAAGVWDALSGARGEPAEGGRLEQHELGRVLWAAAGLVDARDRAHLVPGEVSGLEAYVLVHGVRDLSVGRYHYDVREHTLEQLGCDDPLAAAAHALADRAGLEAYAATLVLTGVPRRLAPHHGARAYRLLSLEAGAAAQAGVVAAAALGLTGTLVADFYDAEVASLLDLDPALEPPLAVVLIGR